MRRVVGQISSAKHQNRRASRSRLRARLQFGDLQVASCRMQPTGFLPRRGMTLVELLVAILIIAILGALVIGVAAVAGETARESRTRNMVDRLHTLVMEHMDTYKNRRIKLSPTVEQTISQNNSLIDRQKREAIAEARLYAVREMMLSEMPDRWSDVLLSPVPSSPSVNDGLAPLYLPQRTSLSNVYLRRYQQLVGRENTITGNRNTRADILSNQGAECLYLLVTLATADGEARTLFHESNIGDTDGDGAPEFLDGWGHPIEFLRWAPGFDSEIQSNANELDNPLSGTSQEAWFKAASGDHDPYDMFRTHSVAFRMVPLIYSGGRDEEFGYFPTDEYVPWPLTQSFSVSGNRFPYLQPALDPYVKARVDGTSKLAYLGTDNGEKTATDNIHNHLIGER